MTAPPDTILLAYSSAATHRFGRDELNELLAVARRNNESLGVTGMLLYVDDSFFQVLEGAPDKVHALYDAISLDKRHTKVIKLLETAVDARCFADWSMGYAKVTRDELEAIPGLNDFFGRGTALDALEPGRTKLLLEAFREGRWRRRLGG